MYQRCILILSIVFLNSRVIAFGQDVTILICNKSGFDLDSLTFGEVTLGRVKKDSVVAKTIDKITLIGGSLPFDHAVALINGIVSNKPPLGCSTKTIEVTSGSFAIDLIAVQVDNTIDLRWSRRK